GLLTPLPCLPFGCARLLLLPLVLSRVDAHLSAVDLIPGEVEATMLLPGKLNLLPVDLACVDPDVDVCLLGVAVYDGEATRARELPVEPLLHHSERLLVGDVPLKARQDAVVGAGFTP